MRAVSRRFTLCFVAFGIAPTPGCREATNPPPVAEEPKVASNPKRAEEGVETREGELQTSKGFGAVADVLLPHDVLEEKLGSDWRKTMVGKRVRVRGKLRIHKCGPMEQCLIQGELPILTPDSIEVLP
ncbi:hypothetical protein [Polyangium sp. y55x31]|uniref:hypothetical protein n=1 Tax=Polyangium sp. y55x31 TaxID=3042688 RepID=UPI002483171C|nr:hypothetical protein [Polyangium sp. y55x31]MDI1481759.1 hypothetical protein [Polyangium sp. y55x31]